MKLGPGTVGGKPEGSGQCGGHLPGNAEKNWGTLRKKLAGSGHAQRAAQFFPRFLSAALGQFYFKVPFAMSGPAIGTRLAVQTMPKGTLEKLAGCSKRNLE